MRPVPVRPAALVLAAALAAACGTRTAQEVPVIREPAAAAAPAPAVAPGATLTATFAVGWFWGPDSRFGSLPGVVRTRVGYAGGAAASPTYRSIGDHTEAFQVDFDPTKTTYEALLEAFWAAHDPSARKWSVQYANLLLAHDDAQERAARESAARLADRTGREVRTEIRRLDRFWPAEDYHQKYALRGDARLMDLVRPFAADDAALRESPLAARLNAFAAGDLAFEALRDECGALGWIVEGDGRPERIRARAVDAATAR